MSVNWDRNLRAGLALATVAGIIVDIVCARLVLRKIERKIDQPFNLGVSSERRRAELDAEAAAEDQGQSDARVTPLVRPSRRSS